MANSLQSLLKELTAYLPRLVATNLIRDKLAPMGLAGQDAVVDALVDHILGGAADGSFDLEFDVPEGRLPENISLAFGDEDLAF
jgi:hypothetical protein